MPITIDGTGNITGIVAGGLPDGSVNNADLATDAVSTSKILNGAVTTAKLGTNEASGLCKAWVNFNGTGTVAIRASYNVSSITDNGVGDYTVNFTTALADANYSTTITYSIQWGGGWALGSGYTQAAAISSNQAPTLSAFRFSSAYISGTTQAVYDPQYVMASVFR